MSTNDPAIALNASADPARWPVPRADMINKDLIAERMAEDMAIIIDARGLDASGDAVVTEDDLRRCGWLAIQIRHCGDRAGALYREKRGLALGNEVA